MRKHTSFEGTVEMVIVKKEVMSPQDFLRVQKSEPGSIKTASFLPPRIGQKSFGAFEVEYRHSKLIPAE